MILDELDCKNGIPIFSYDNYEKIVFYYYPSLQNGEPITSELVDQEEDNLCVFEFLHSLESIFWSIKWPKLINDELNIWAGVKKGSYELLDVPFTFGFVFNLIEECNRSKKAGEEFLKNFLEFSETNK